MKHPPKILTIAPLMRAWNPPNGERLEEEDTNEGAKRATNTTDNNPPPAEHQYYLDGTPKACWSPGRNRTRV